MNYCFCRNNLMADRRSVCTYFRSFKMWGSIRIFQFLSMIFDNWCCSDRKYKPYKAWFLNMKVLGCLVFLWQRNCLRKTVKDTLPLHKTETSLHQYLVMKIQSITIFFWRFGFLETFSISLEFLGIVTVFLSPKLSFIWFLIFRIAL